MDSSEYKVNTPLLSEGDTHIWKVSLTLDESKYNFLEILSNDEKRRAERFKFDIHRKRFITARGMLRTILGKYLHMQPQDISFRYTGHGKPYLDHDTNLFFNASDSQDLAVYALTLNREVGIDIEYMKDAEYQAIADRFFSSTESKTLKNLNEIQKKQAFFNGWTRKEAFVKALGEGLSFPLKYFSVSLAPEEPAVLLDIYGDKKAARDWSMQSLDLPNNYAGTVVLKGKISHLLYFQWNQG